MTTGEPRARAPRPDLDREAAPEFRLRLTLFGAAAILVGVGFLVLGLLQLLLAYVGPTIDAGAAGAGVALNLLIALVLVVGGIGSIRRRRWVRPVMLLVSGTWILVGAAATWFLLRLGPELALAAGLDSADPVATIVHTVLLASAAGVGILLPAAFLWAYRDPRVQLACDSRSRAEGRGDGCPAEVLTLSVALAAAGLLSLPMLGRPVVPLFGHLVTGRAGLLALAAGIVTCGVLAWSTHRLRAEGYWATLVFLVLLGVSTVWTFARVDAMEVYRLLGYPEELLVRLPSIGPATRTMTQVGAVVLTLGGVAWLLSLRRHFT